MYQANTNQKQVTGLVSYEVDFRTRNILDKEKHYIMT